MLQYLNEQEQYNVEDGTKVLALYIGSVQFKGTIAGSRAAYGTAKEYFVVLDNDMFLPWCGDGKSARYIAGETISVEHKHIVAIVK